MAEISFDFTVAIPTFNGATRISQTLDYLSQQIGTDDLSWEIIVVDNNSSDSTREIVKGYQEKPSSVPLRYIFEPCQGAAFARQKAVVEARGKWIAFLDDDVQPALNWLAEAHKFSTSNQHIGAFSGRIIGSYEVEPPAGFEHIQQFLAIRDHGDEPKLFAAQNLQLPPAASLIIRKQAWIEHVPPEPKLTGKLPGLLVQGDDYEPLLYLHRAGWEIWYAPHLYAYHQIPETRFDRAYLLTLGKGCGLATYSLGCILIPKWKQFFLLLRTVFGNIRRLVGHYVNYQQRIHQELVPAFLWEFYWGSLLSPFLGFYKFWVHGK